MFSLSFQRNKTWNHCSHFYYYFLKSTWGWINTSQKWSQIPLENVKLWIKPHRKSSLPLDFPVAHSMNYFHSVIGSWIFICNQNYPNWYREIFKFYKVEAYPGRYMTWTVSTRQSKTKLKQCVRIYMRYKTAQAKSRPSGAFLDILGSLVVQYGQEETVQPLGAFFKTFQ